MKMRLIGITALLAVSTSVHATLLVYEGFEYATGTVLANGTLNGGTGLSASPWATTDTTDAHYEITADATTWGALTTTSNRLHRTSTGGVEAISRGVTADLDSGAELWFSLLYDCDSNTGFGIASDPFVDTQYPTLAAGQYGFGFRHDGGGMAGWVGVNGVSTLSAYNTTAFVADQWHFLVGRIQFNNDGGLDTYTLYDVGEDLVLGTPLFTMTADIDESTLDTITMTSNRGPGWDEIRLGTTSADVIAVASEFIFSLDPNNSQDIDVGYPAVSGTNSFFAAYANSAAGVEISALNVTGDSNAFSAVTSVPFTITDPSPSNAVLDFAFDASAVKAITGATEGFNANGSVDVVWKNLDDNVLQTNTVALVGKFTNPVFGFNIASSVGIVLQAPATVASNDVAVSYVEGRPGHTNVEIYAVNVLNESHAGSFSAINPGVIANPAPSNDVITVIFNNGVAGLGNKEGATADLEVIYGEVGGSITYTSTVAVSAYNYDLSAGVIQQVFGSPANVLLDVGAGATPLNNFGAYTNQWVADSGLRQNLSTGCIELPSAGNTRSAFNLIEAGTAGVDNFGAVDTHILTNGLYRYDFDYEATGVDGADLWSFNAYALINQGAFSTSSNPDKVTIDLATGTSGGVEVDIENRGIAYYSQHPNGILRGTNNAARSSGSVYLNVQDGEDAVFVMHRSGACTLRMYDLVLTRIGDYDPNTDFNDPNAVLAAKFDSIESTNAIVTGLTRTDTNTNGVNNTWRGNNVSWDSQAFQTSVNDSAIRVAAIITRAGTSGYDDVGLSDTIPLSQGSYSLTMDVNITGSFPSNDSVARVEFYALSQDLSGDVNDVIIKHSLITDAYMVANGSAGITLLASKEYTASATETLSFSNMNVLASQDVAIVFYNRNGPDTIVDNVELVRTGNAVLSGYDGWAQQFVGFYDTALTSDPEGDGINNLLEYALNGNPTVANTSILPDSYIGAADGTNWLYFVHTERTDDGTLTYTVQINDNLVYGTWTNNSQIIYVGESTAVGNYKAVTNKTDATSSAEFLRLRVQKN